jgi:primosomal protein N' (replication factor Y)
VERIADEVQAILPQARILIMSSDKLANLKAVQEAVAGIQKGEVDVIVGTQLIAKGHDFKGLSCVGVIDGDLGLVGGDLRSGERTFQLLMQVAGRAGRHHTIGRVFLQTYDPESALMQALALADRDAFMAAEVAERKAFGWPPYGRLASLILSSRDEALLEKCVKVLARKAPLDPAVRVLGPAPAALFKVRGKFRWRFLIKTPKSLPPQTYIHQWLSQIKLPRTIACQVDIDPQSFF